MNKILSIIMKELNQYFKSPMAYIVILIALSIFNIFFYLIINENREAHLEDVFKVMEFMFVFLIPILTMKIFSEEKQTGTMEFLLTSPVSISDIVFGKFLGGLLFFSLIIALTELYALILLIYGKPDVPSMASGYIGVWLEGMMFIAIGIFISSLTASQMIAAISSYAVVFTLYFGFTLTQYVPSAWHDVIKAVSVMTHSENLFAGLIYLSDAVYFLSITVFFLVLTIFSIDCKRWQ